MRIQVKLMGSLRSQLPTGSQGGKASLDVDAGTTIAALLEKLGIRGGQVHLVMVNGSMEQDRQRVLMAGEEVAVFPPVAGG